MKYILTLIVQILVTLSVLGQKSILIEKFTNIYCGSCPNAHLIIKDYLDQYPEAIWVNHHKPIDFDVNELVNQHSVVLWEDFNVPGVPTAMINRIATGNSVARPSSTWGTLIESEKQAEALTQVEIKDVSYDLDTRTFGFQVETIFKTLPTQGDYRISVMMIEDGVYDKQHSYFNDVAGHPLEGRGDIIWDYVHSNVVRTIIDGGWGTAGVIPQSIELNTTYGKEYTYTVPEAYKAHRFKIVAVVSRYGEDDITNAQVLNATEVDTRDLDLILSASEEVESEEMILTLSPNPASDILNVQFNEIPQFVYIINELGQQVVSLQPKNKSLNLDIDSYKVGGYYLLAEVSGVQYTETFVISR